MTSGEHELIEWQEPWAPLTTDAHRWALETELRKEVVHGHVLYGRRARAVASRADQDDVLFEVSDPPEFAVVHLTYSQGPDRPPWPRTTLLASLHEFADRMRADAADYRCGENPDGDDVED